MRHHILLPNQFCVTSLASVLLLFAINGLGAEGSRLVYGEATRLDHFDPYTVHEASAQRLADLLFDSLVEVGANGDFQPKLAKSWSIEHGSSEIVCVLREDVIWHDSTPDLRRAFTADDVANTVRLITAKDSKIPNKEQFSVLAGVQIISPYKIRIYLKRPLMQPLAALQFKVLPQHLLGDIAALNQDLEFAKHPIGTGPYLFTSTNKSGEVILKSNKSYFGGEPNLKSIVMKTFTDQSVMAQSLMFSAIDLITYVNPSSLSEIEGDRALRTVPYDALSYTFIGINTQKPYLKLKRVRQALASAINRKEMLEAFYQNQGELISGPFPPSSWAYNLDVKNTEFSTQHAKELFKNEGLIDRNNDGYLDGADGQKLSFEFLVPVSAESDAAKKLSLALQSYFKEVGVNLNLKFLDWVVWKKRVLQDHDYDLTIGSWNFDDSANITTLFHSSNSGEWGNNFVGYKNKDVDSLLTEAGATNDFEKKRAIYNKLHAVLADETPYIYLWTLKHHASYKRQFENVKIEPLSFFKYIVTWKFKESKGG